MRVIFLMLMVIFLSCKKCENDFDSLMGKDLTFIETVEDEDNLQFFRDLYSYNFKKVSGGSYIPKTLHFIWLGSAPLPKESRQFIRSWIAKHKDWQINLWTDRYMKAFDPALEVKVITSGDLPHLGTCFFSSDNEGERAALLRCEILYREGGVAIDTDVLCKKSLLDFNKTYEFYTGLAPLRAPYLSTSVLLAPHILAARREHPIIEKAMEGIAERWDFLGEAFSGSDMESTIARVLHRTLVPLQKATFSEVSSDDIVFPTQMFHSIVAEHREERSWVKDEERFEKKVKESLIQISGVTRKLVYGALAMLAINLCLFFVVVSRKNGRR